MANIRVQTADFDIGAEFAALCAGRADIGGLGSFVGTVRDTAKGRKMMDKLFPAFNKQERQLAASIDSSKQSDFAEMLRLITKKAEATN